MERYYKLLGISTTASKVLHIVTDSYSVGHTAGVHLTFGVSKFSHELNINNEINKI